MEEEKLNNEAMDKETSENEVKKETSETSSETIAGKGSEDKKKDKKKDKKEELLKNRIEELEDLTKRQMAEFENFRRRTEKEKSLMFDMGAKNVIEKILPVIDNFERGLATVDESELEDGFAGGMNKIYRQLMTELEKLDVKPIEAKGKEFNPEFHNAVMQVEIEGVESGTVAEELLKGYTYHDSVVRHSMVSVVS